MSFYIELIGYIGSWFVSMLMTSITKLRVVNMTGSVISIIYALIIGSFPVALMNICLLLINAYNIIKLKRQKTQMS